MYFLYSNSLKQTEYIIRVSPFHFHIVDENGNEVLHARRSLATINQRDIYYLDETEKQEVASIIWLGVREGTAFHIQDENRVTYGILKPNWLTGSFLQEEWHLQNESRQMLYVIREDNLFLSLIRRYLKTFPQKYIVTANGAEVCCLTRNWNPFLPRMNVSFFGQESDKCLLLLAATVIATYNLSSGSL